MNKPVTVVLLSGIVALSVSAQTWTDISTALVQSKGMTFPGGVTNCSGVCVNRLTGDVVVKFIDNGIWRSSDQGATWVRIDNSTVSGRCETSWGVQVCQDNPTHMAIFSLDGTSGYTPDGTTWSGINASPAAGRGFDFGSVDWGATVPKVMMASAHESGGQIALSTNGGTVWTMLSVTFNGSNPNSGTTSTVGVMDSNTLVYSSGSGISRSTDRGATWTKVSSVNPQSRVVVPFGGKYYLGTAAGLIVSADKGLTWTTQGASVNIYQGPFFGADENTMVVVGTLGFYKTTNAGAAWSKIANLPPAYSGNTFDPQWFGGFSWDPIHNVAYATRMVCPAYKYVLPATGTVDPLKAGLTERNALGKSRIVTASGGRILIKSDARGLFTVRGCRQ